MTTINAGRNPWSFLLLAAGGASLLMIGMVLGALYMPSPSGSTGLNVSSWSLRGSADTSQEIPSTAADPASRADNLPFIRAKRVQDAIKRHDFVTATKISSETLAASRAKIWTFYPFTDFVRSVSDLADPSFERSLTAWIDKSPLNPLPRLVRAQYYYDLAWYKRGHRFTRETDKQAQAAFVSILRKAVDDINRVVTDDPDSAYGLYLRLKILASYGPTPETKKAFNEAIAVYPEYMPLYQTALAVLQPKWGGNVDMMYAFVDHYAGKAPQDSPLRLLSLQLYQFLLASAGTACAEQHGDAYTSCAQTVMKQTIRPGLDADAAGALRQFGQMNAFETNMAVADALSDMISQSAAGPYSGQLLQIAADSYHSDPRLVEAPNTNNNFIIDKLVARSWLYKGFYDNAITKYKEALSHADTVTFPTPEQKDMAIADIYETLARMYSKDHRPAEMIDAARAALALDGKASNRIYLCFGYYRMKQYDKAIDECSQIAANPESGVEAHYWRGLVYEAMQQGEKAVQDLLEVADSQDNWRVNAAIEISMIYFNRKDNKSALDILNKYPYLYDTNVTAKDDVAVSYNNRCYAYMELGELQKALDDCNASLANGSIPDAFKKKQELVARLSH